MKVTKEQQLVMEIEDLRRERDRLQAEVVRLKPALKVVAQTRRVHLVFAEEDGKPCQCSYCTIWEAYLKATEKEPMAYLRDYVADIQAKPVKAADTCPDCGRPKAHNVQDMQAKTRKDGCHD